MNKAESTISVYHTLARFGAAIAAELPEKLSMCPEGRGSGDFLGAYGGNPATGDYVLGPPIAKLAIADLVDKDSIGRFRTVLQAWLELDYENVTRYQNGLRTMDMPDSYTTGEVPVSTMTLGLGRAGEQARAVAQRTAVDTLGWLVMPGSNDGDYTAALLGLLLLRHARVKVPLFPLMALATKTKLGQANQADPAALGARLDEVLAGIRALVEPTEGGA